MSCTLNIKDYLSWSLSEKLFFFDSKQYTTIEGLNEQELILFLKSFILQPAENRYIAKKALSLFIDYTLLGKIPNRHTLNLLIDETNDINGTFCQIERLKSLLLFFEQEPKSIKEIFEKNAEHLNTEIKSESLYSLGVIDFLAASKEVDETTFRKKLESSIILFRTSYLCTENRIDSLFFFSIAETILNIRLPVSPKLNLKNITQLLWDYRLFSLNEESLIFKGMIYRIICNLIYIIKQNPNEWLQYKDEFKSLSLAVYELKNAELKDRLIQSHIIDNLKANITTATIEPYFRLNFSAVEFKIEHYLSLPEVSKEEKEVLSYILSLTKDKPTDTTLSYCVRQAIDCLTNIYPQTHKQRISDLFNNVSCSNDVLMATMNAHSLFGEFSFDNLQDKLMSALIKLQGDFSCRNKTEDERNTYICNLLSMAGIHLKDQTRWGSSSQGKAAGEVDILVLDNVQLPFSIIEALILDSLKQDYLNLHIDKVYKYDTTGQENNIIVIYSEAKKFSDFCSKYIDYVSNYQYPYSLISIENMDSGYSEIKICKSILERNGCKTNLYHFIVNMA